MTSTARRFTTVFALLLALPATAHASSVAVDGGVLTIDAGGSYLDLDVQQDGADFVVFDYSGGMTTGEGCEAARADPTTILTGADGDQYTCTGSIVSVHVTGG